MPDVSPPVPRRPGFQPGVSGNPGGKPRGTPTRPREPLDALLRRIGARHGRVIVKALLAAARRGDPAAAGALLSAVQRAGAGEASP